MSGCQLTHASLSDEPGWEGGRHFADEGEGIVKVSVIVIASIFAILLRFCAVEGDVFRGNPNKPIPVCLQIKSMQ